MPKIEDVLQQVRGAIEQDKEFTLPEGPEPMTCVSAKMYDLGGNRIGYSLRIYKDNGIRME